MQFGIDQNVNHAVTDTTRNMMKAFKLPGYTEDEDEDEDEEEDCNGQGGENYILKLRPISQQSTMDALHMYFSWSSKTVSW